MFYIFHGEDEFSRSEALAELKEKMEDATTADLNTTTLDGRKVTLAELIHACDTVPFMAERRLVIVENLLTHLSSSRGNGVSDELNKLAEYLGRLPGSTRLFFVESKSMNQAHPILKLARKHEKGYAKEFTLPKRGRLHQWIEARTRERGGSITPEAARQLAAFVGNDLRLLDQEIEKLITYVASGRPATEDDVQLLVSSVREANIFHMGDALARRQGQKALEILHRLLEDGASPIYLLFMIVRQFRILLKIKELQRKGMLDSEIRLKLGLHPFVIEKGVQQAQNFRLAQLEAIYRRLVEVDQEVKTGRMDPVLALDLLVSGLSRGKQIG